MFLGFGPACFRLNIRTSRFLVQAEWPSVLFKSSINIINTQDHSRGSKNIIEPWKYIPLKNILKHTIFHLFHSKNGHNNQYSNRESGQPLTTGNPWRCAPKTIGQASKTDFRQVPEPSRSYRCSGWAQLEVAEVWKKKHVHLKTSIPTP